MLLELKTSSIFTMYCCQVGIGHCPFPYSGWQRLSLLHLDSVQEWFNLWKFPQQILEILETVHMNWNFLGVWVVCACGRRDSVDLSAYSCYLNKCKQSLTAAYLASQQQRGGDQFLKCFYRFVQQQALKMTRWHDDMVSKLPHNMTHSYHFLFVSLWHNGKIFEQLNKIYGFFGNVHIVELVQNVKRILDKSNSLRGSLIYFQFSKSNSTFLSTALRPLLP